MSRRGNKNVTKLDLGGPNFTMTLSRADQLKFVDFDSRLDYTEDDIIAILEGATDEYQLQIIEHNKYSIRELAYQFLLNICYPIEVKNKDLTFQKMVVRSPVDNDLMVYDKNTKTATVLQDLIDIQKDKLSRRVLEELQGLVYRG
jgi:hypothetical protein